MMDPAQARQRTHSGVSGRLGLDRTSLRGVLVQGIVNAILFVIADVIADQAAQVPLIQGDDVVQDFPTATSDPSFCGSVLPGCLETRPLDLLQTGTEGSGKVIP